VSRRQKSEALLDVTRFNPKFAALIIVLGVVAAVVEGVGLSFILPVIEIVQPDDPTTEAEGAMAVFISVYQFLGVPFSL